MDSAPSRIRKKILVVDDDEPTLQLLEHFFLDLGYTVECTPRASEALARIAEIRFDLVILDLMMPGANGLDVLRQARQIDDHLSILIMTGHGTVGSAVEAIKLGAEDYLLKPVDLDALHLCVTRALSSQMLRVENRLLRERAAGIAKSHGIVARSAAMLDILGLVAKVAPLRSTVLIQGESGTGKELVARAIHEQSARTGGRFVAVNCAVIPPSLLESELFGHERGSFRGAEGRRIGYFEEADGGTIFLDEISETPLELQVKLLRVLQERTFRRLGGGEEISTNTRVIASTNRRLEDQVQAGKFRQDLYYRLNVICLNVPPLRDRPEDVPLLAHHFLAKYAGEFNKPVRALSPAVMETLLRYTWPGNVRELENAIERAIAVADTTEIGLADMASLQKTGPVPEPLQFLPYLEARARFEKDYVASLLRASGGNVAMAARMAGLARQNFYQKLRKLGIDRSAGGDS